MPNPESLISDIVKANPPAEALPIPLAAVQDAELRDRMARIVRHAANESDLIFPEDGGVEDSFAVVASAFVDALAQCGDVVAAVKTVFPRLSGRRLRTPAKVGTLLLEVMRQAATSVGEYNREVFARAGITPVSVARVLFRLMTEDGVPAKERLAAINLADRFCDLTAPTAHAPGGPSVVVPVQVNTGRRGRPKGATKRNEFIEADITERGREVRDAIFTEGGGRVNGERKVSVSKVEDLEGQSQFPWGEAGGDDEAGPAV
jgi:hypothetical protein